MVSRIDEADRGHLSDKQDPNSRLGICQGVAEQEGGARV